WGHGIRLLLTRAGGENGRGRNIESAHFFEGHAGKPPALRGWPHCHLGGHPRSGDGSVGTTIHKGNCFSTSASVEARLHRGPCDRGSRDNAGRHQRDGRRSEED